MTTSRPSAPRHSMTGWYDPQQLLRTAGSVFVSTLFGRFSDHRLMEALAAGQPTVEDLSDRDDIVVDYVADVGDGWDSTYAVAYWLTRPLLRLRDAGAEYSLRRGDVLIFGGDQVYPTPSRIGYKEKLVAPYRSAMPYTQPPHPLVFALPGNHDWYDSLVSFTRLFCRPPGGPEKWFAGWQTAQSRSYFAVKLPGRWWLAAIDVQLASNIDEPQVAYFREIAAHMSPGDRVIVCTAEPDWIYRKWWGPLSPEYTSDNTNFIENKLFAGKVRVCLAGDLHHYRRHESADRRQKITAGGGGAFLHPTHQPDSELLEDGFVCKKAFPEPARSRRLAFGNLAFIVRNPTFAIATGIAYALIGWNTLAGVQLADAKTDAVVALLVDKWLSNPPALAIVGAVFLGFWLFTDTHSKPYRLVAGTVHAAVHLLAAIAASWLSFTVAARWFDGHVWAVRLASGAATVAAGAIVGPIVFGVYLLISLNVFGRHSTEAFSSLRIADFKNFLRIVIRRDGALTIYPVKLERVPRTWKAGHGGVSGPEYVPHDARATDPALIEPPIVL